MHRKVDVPLFAMACQAGVLLLILLGFSACSLIRWQSTISAGRWPTALHYKAVSNDCG